MHEVTAYWEGDMQFTSTNPSGNSFFIDTTPENGGENNGMHPKALMLSALAGCTGLDVLALLKKKQIVLDNFTLDVQGKLAKNHPRIYEEVTVNYYFEGEDLDVEQITQVVSLSVEKYCGVIAMFRQFATVQIKLFFNSEEHPYHAE